MAIHLNDIIEIVSSQLKTSSNNQEVITNITESTRLVRDLGFSSVEFVVIFDRIQRFYKRRVDFIDLIMPDRSTYVDDLSINEIASFLSGYSSAMQVNTTTDPYELARSQISQSDINLLNEAIRHQEYAAEVVETRSPICFLLSAPRSGSTLLRRMLGCHREIYAPMELHLMTYQSFQQRKDELNTNLHAHLLEGTIVARQQLRGMSRTVSVAVEQMYIRDKRPVSHFFTEIDPYLQGRVLIDKTPTYAFSRDTIERIKNTFPQAKFIHLRRRPNAVIKSIIDSDLGELIRFHETSGIQKDRFAEALWCLCEQNILGALEHEESRVIRVNYETVVEEPEKTLNRIHKFLGIALSSDVDPYARIPETTEEQVTSYAGDLKNYLRSGIDASVSTEWERFASLHWLSQPTLDLLQNERFPADDQEGLC